MPPETLAVLEWTALFWGGALLFGLLAYAGEALLILLSRKRR